MKLLFTSDWHLDATTSGKRRSEEIEAAIDFSVQVAIEEHVDLYVFGGDLCDPDGWNVLRAVGKTIEVAAKLSHAGIDSLWIAGNHDVLEDGLGTTTLTPLLKCATQGDPAFGVVTVCEEPASMTYGEHTVIALPFTPRSHAYDPDRYAREVVGKLKTKEREKCMVVGHLNLKGATPGSETEDMPRGREVMWPVATLKRLVPKAFLIGGHYHSTQDIDGVTMIGSLARLTHGEEAHTPALLVVEL